MTRPRNVNRCTPCLAGDHRRCTGSAGNIGCGCIHAAPVPVPLDDGPELEVERVPADYSPATDPRLLRERYLELRQRAAVQQALVDRLAAILADEREECSVLTAELGEVQRKLAQVPPPDADPGKGWHRAVRRPDGHALRLDPGVTARVAVASDTGAVWFAPLGTPDPVGDGWTLSEVTVPGGLS